MMPPPVIEWVTSKAKKILIIKKFYGINNI